MKSMVVISVNINQRSCVEVARLPKDVKVEIEVVGKVKGI